MFDNWNFSFNNAPLPEALQQKLRNHNVLQPLPDTFLPHVPETRFIKDFFRADGFPKIGESLKHSEVAYPYLFPAIAPWYDSAAIPSAVLEADPTYRETACLAALSWLYTLMTSVDRVNPRLRTFHGLAFQETINGTPITFAFPDTRIATDNNGVAAVVLIADSYWNNGEWEKQASVPLYARQQAMFQLWCWNKFAEKCGYAVEPLQKAYIVRICGNLAIDCTIRTVEYNEKEASALVNRICKAREMEATKGLYWKRNVESAQTWTEKLDNEAFHTDNADLHELVVRYMKARSNRKVIERELNEIENKMNAIAVELASYIPSGDIQGTYDMPDGTLCTVTHQMKRKSTWSITPEILRSFYPSLDGFISPSGGSRTTVTIEAL